MKISELQRKDIVNVNDGKVIGRIIDAIINEEDGSFEGFVIEKSKYIRSLFSTRIYDENWTWNKDNILSY